MCATQSVPGSFQALLYWFCPIEGNCAANLQGTDAASFLHCWANKVLGQRAGASTLGEEYLTPTSGCTREESGSNSIFKLKRLSRPHKHVNFPAST